MVYGRKIPFGDGRRRVLGRTRRADVAVQKIVGKFGVSPASARNLQQALIYDTFLYGVELSWVGTKKEEKKIQVFINRMRRASLGVHRTIPVGTIMAESTLPPAGALLDYCQAPFTLRLLSRPVGGGEQEEIIEKRNSVFTARIKRECGIGRGETIEVQMWEEFRELGARVIVEGKEEALRTARKWSDHQGTIWTNGSRIESGAVGAGLTFRTERGWDRRGNLPGKE